MVVWVSDGHDMIFGHEGRHPDCSASDIGNGRFQFKHGQFLAVASHHALDADGYRPTASVTLNPNRLPLLGGEFHPGGNMRSSDNRRRRLKRRGSACGDDAGLCATLGVVEISRDATAERASNGGSMHTVSARTAVENSAMKTNAQQARRRIATITPSPN